MDLLLSSHLLYPLLTYGGTDFKMGHGTTDPSVMVQPNEEKMNLMVLGTCMKSDESHNSALCATRKKWTHGTLKGRAFTGIGIPTVQTMWCRATGSCPPTADILQTPTLLTPNSFFDLRHIMQIPPCVLSGINTDSGPTQDLSSACQLRP